MYFFLSYLVAMSLIDLLRCILDDYYCPHLYIFLSPSLGQIYSMFSLFLLTCSSFFALPFCDKRGVGDINTMTFKFYVKQYYATLLFLVCWLNVRRCHV